MFSNRYKPPPEGRSRAASPCAGEPRPQQRAVVGHHLDVQPSPVPLRKHRFSMLLLLLLPSTVRRRASAAATSRRHSRHRPHHFNVQFDTARSLLLILERCRYCCRSYRPHFFFFTKGHARASSSRRAVVLASSSRRVVAGASSSRRADSTVGSSIFAWSTRSSKNS